MKLTDVQYQEKVNELHTTYKHLFEQDEEGNILRGIEVGAGWLGITENLLWRLEWYRQNRRHVPNPEYDPLAEYTIDNSPYMKGACPVIKIFQVKEKFGLYTVYVKCPDRIEPEVQEAVGYAKGQSALTCERCGKVENITLTTSGWIANLCEECKSVKW